MGVRATFSADFTSFLEATKKAEVSINMMQGSAANAEKGLQKMVTSLNGSKLIADATIAAEGVERIGGVANLTEKELKRLGGTAQEAVAKMRALGVDIPPGVQNLANETKNLAAQGQNLTSVFTSVTGVLGGLGIGLGIGGLVQFGKAIFEDADQLEKMADKTGIGVEGLQRLRVASDDAGNTLDDVTSSINKMQKNLATGNDSAVSALGTLGIRFDDIKKLQPDDQFIAISDAIRKIQDPAEQVALAMALFGKSGAEVLPTLKRGFDDIRDSSGQMSKETVKALDDIGDSFTRNIRRIKALAGTETVNLFKAFEAPPADDKLQGFLDDMDDLSNAAKLAIPTVEKLNPTFKSAADGALGFTDAAGKVHGLLVGLPSDIDAVYKDLEKGAEAQKKANAAAEAHAKTLENLRNQLSGAGLLSAAKDFETTLNAIGGASHLTTEEQKKYSAELQTLVDKYRLLGPAGAAVVAHFEALRLQIQPLLPTSQAYNDTLTKQLAIVPDLANRTSEFGDELQRVLDLPIVTGFEDAARAEHALQVYADAVTASHKALDDQLARTIGLMPDLSKEAKDSMSGFLNGTNKSKDGSRDLDRALGELSNDFVQLSQIGGAAFSPVLREIGEVVKLTEVAARTFETFGKTATEAGKAATAATNSTTASALSGAAAVGTLAVAWYEFFANRNQAALAEQNAASAAAADKRLADQFHTTSLFSDQLNRSISTMTKTLEGTSGTASAAGLHINSIVQELGGWASLTAEQLKAVEDSIDHVTKQTSTGLGPNPSVILGGQQAGLIALIAQGGTTGTRATKELDQALADMGQTALDTSGIVDKFFLDEIAKAKALGAELPEVNKLLAGQTTSAESGIASAIGVTTDAYAKQFDLQNQIADLTAQQKGQRGAEADETAAKIADLNKQLEDQGRIIDATSIHSQQAAEGVSGALVGLVGSQVEAGTSFAEALRNVAPSVEALGKELDKAGYAGGETFDFLKREVALVSDAVAGPALQSIDGFTAGLTGMYNAGLLTEGTFKGLTSQIGDTVSKLEAQGVNGGDLLVAMQSDLQKVWELEQKTGFQADANTQGLVDQAAAQGLVGAEHRSTSDQMIASLNHIADAMDVWLKSLGLVPPAVDAATASARTGAADTGQALDDTTGKALSLVGALGTDVPEGAGKMASAATDASADSVKALHDVELHAALVQQAYEDAGGAASDFGDEGYYAGKSIVQGRSPGGLIQINDLVLQLGKRYTTLGSDASEALGLIYADQKQNQNALDKMTTGWSMLSDVIDGLNGRADSLSDHIKAIVDAQQSLIDLAAQAGDIQGQIDEMGYQKELDAINDQKKALSDMAARTDDVYQARIDALTAEQNQLKANGATAKQIADVQAQIDAQQAQRDAAKKQGAQQLAEIQAQLDAKNADHQAAADAKKLADLQKQLDAVHQQQAEAEKVAKGIDSQGLFNSNANLAALSFAAQVKQTGDIGSAISAIAPSLKSLSDAEDKLGFTASPAIQKIIDLYRTISSNQDVTDAISTDNQALTALAAIGWTDKETLVAFGNDAEEAFKTLTARGVDANTALALIGPTLQVLGKHTDDLAGAFDDTGAAIWDLAKRYGIVGDDMVQTNERILKSILDIQGAIANTVPGGTGGIKAPPAPTGAGNIDLITQTEAESLVQRAAQKYMGHALSASDLSSLEGALGYTGGTVSKSQLDAYLQTQVEALGKTWTGYKNGGVVNGPAGDDVIPAWLTAKEGVVNQTGMQTLGKDGLDALNRGRGNDNSALRAEVAELRSETARQTKELQGLRGDLRRQLSYSEFDQKRASMNPNRR